MLFLNKLTLKIHCWGGLGSQLLALNYYLRVQELYPRKRIILVLHTGGITARNSEIDFLSNRINLRKVDDYHAGANDRQPHASSSKPIFYFLKSFIKSLANYFRFVITDDKKVLKVKFWTLSVRCTYTSNVLRIQDVVHMADILGITSNGLEHNFIGVHYRMGDLPTLKPESLISLNAISTVINDILRNGALVNKIKIFSDSILNDSDLQLPKKIDIEWKSVDTLQTISELSKAKCFIGTNSKVSFWVAIFRLCLSAPGDIYLPFNSAKNISNVLNLEDKDFDSISKY